MQRSVSALTSTLGYIINLTPIDGLLCFGQSDFCFYAVYGNGCSVEQEYELRRLLGREEPTALKGKWTVKKYIAIKEKQEKHGNFSNITFSLFFCSMFLNFFCCFINSFC